MCEICNSYMHGIFQYSRMFLFSCIILCAESFTEQAPCQPSLVYQGRRSAVFKVLQEIVSRINEAYTCQCVMYKLCINVDISRRQGEPSVPSSCYQSHESTTYCTTHCHNHHCPQHPRWWAGESVEGVQNDRQDQYSHEEEESVEVRRSVSRDKLPWM